jgi:hypothetical protein
MMPSLSSMIVDYAVFAVIEPAPDKAYEHARVSPGKPSKGPDDARPKNAWLEQERQHKSERNWKPTRKKPQAGSFAA